MTVAPDIKRYGEAELILQSATGGTRTVTVTAQGGAYPGANVGSGTTTLTVDIAEATAGISPPTGSWVIAAVEDNTDVAGDYLGPAAVLDYQPMGTGGALLTSVSLTIPKHGHYRMVLAVGSDPVRARDMPTVDTGGTSSQYHFDTDGNDAEGALNTNSVSGTRVTGYNWREADLQSITYSGADNKFYSNTFTLSTDISSATLINPQQIKVGLRTTSADGSVVDVLDRVTPTTAGAATGVTRNVDTDYAATSTDYYMMVGVNDVLGDGSTPAGELPDFLGAGTIEGTTTSQRAWILFDTPASGYTLANSGDRVYQTAGDLTIASGITIYEDAGTTPGAHTYQTSGYTTLQDYFKRRNPDTTLEHAVPYLEAYVYDAYGNPLNTVNVRAEVRRQTDAGVDNGQNLTTDANGRIRWNYTIATTHAAFNRYVKPGATRQTGSHVGTGPDDPDTPPATFTVANSDYPADYPGPYPAYPRRVWIRGNAFAGVKEPNDDDDNVFGICSEMVSEGMWTGSLTAAALDGNGIPTGTGNREQPLGSGSLKVKLTTKLDEGTIKVISFSEENIKDRAGRPITLTGSEEIDLRRALWNLTLGTVSDAGSDLNDANFSLESPLTYKTGNGSLGSIAAPTDPSSLAYYQGYADSSAQRSTFTLTTDNTNVGFTSDVGNFGYRRQPVSFFAIDLSITCVVTPAVTQSDPTLTRRVGVKVLRITTDNLFVPVTPDEPPVYAVYGLAEDGTQDLLESGLATATANPEDFYVDLEIPLGYFAVKVVAFGKVNGSRTPGGDGTPIQIGYQSDSKGTITGFQSK